MIRKLTTILIISGILNVCFLTIILYGMFREHPPIPYFELKPANSQEQLSPLAIDHSNSDVIRYFRKMPLEWLSARLKNTQLVENGYTQRDLALATLVAFYHFDLDKALSGSSFPEQKRTIIYGKLRDGKPAELTVYPGLTENQYGAIATFATTERWPLTSKGLFSMLHKQSQDGRESTLIDAFTMTPEFLAVEFLFSRGQVQVDKSELLNVVLDGTWPMLSTFMEQQKTVQDLSDARRQTFLLDYIVKQHSKSAAQLMLKTDGAFASQKLDDQRVMALLQLLDEKSKDNEQFALSLLKSPRSDEVWKMASTRLYEYAGEPLPAQIQHNTVLTHFVPGAVIAQPMERPKQVVSSAPPIPAPPPKVVVKETPKVNQQTMPPRKVVVANPPPATPISVPTKVVPKPTPKTIAKTIPEPPRPGKLIASSQPAAKVSATKTDTTYVVQEGDSLWKVASKFHVDIEVLRSTNKLESDTLRPGRTLKIPSN